MSILTARIAGKNEAMIPTNKVTASNPISPEVIAISLIS
jgi:hypothetical protein